MISQAVTRDIRRALANRRFEIDEKGGGILFQDAKLYAGGVFEHSLNQGPWELAPNLMPKQGRNAMLDIALGAVAKQANWYMAPFATNTAPADTLTAANFASVQTEFTNYAGSSRALWTPAAAVDGVTTNTATPVSITIGNGVQVNMYGLGLISSSAKSATTGLLGACALFMAADNVTPRPRLGLVEGDDLGLRYTITLTST